MLYIANQMKIMPQRHEINGTKDANVLLAVGEMRFQIIYIMEPKIIKLPEISQAKLFPFHLILGSHNKAYSEDVTNDRMRVAMSG